MKHPLRVLLCSLFFLPLTVLAGSTASIYGRVTALDGTTPLSGVQVFAFLNGSQVASSPVTDGNGNYTITGLDTGDYNVGFINPASGQGPQTFGANPVQIFFDGQAFGSVNKSMAGSFTVWNTNDTGTGSLRQRLTAAAATAGANTVDFDPSLAGQTISITTPLTISDAAGINLDFSTLTPAGTTTLAGDFSLGQLVGLKAPPGGRTLNVTGTVTMNANDLALSGAGGVVFSGSLNVGRMIIAGPSVSLQGAGNNSAFAVEISSGSLLLNKSNPGGANLAVSNSLMQSGGTVTFSGTGNQVPAIVGAIMTLQAGVFALTAPSTVLPNLGWKQGGTVRCLLDNAGGPAKMAITGALTKTAGSGAFTFDFQNSGSPGQTYTLATFASSTFAAADFTATGLFPGLTGTFAKTATTLTFTLAEAPNAYQVSNLSDSGDGSLRNVLAFAASQAGSNTVTFASNLSGQTIPVQSELLVNDAGGVAIDASALPLGITLSGGNARRILHTTAGTALTLRRVTFTQGNGVGSDGAGGSNTVSGGALRNLGTLHAVACTFTGNRVANNGGAIANAAGGTATFLGCTFANNQTTGGAANGGAITHGGALLTLRRCTITGNSTAAYAGLSASAIFSLGHLVLEHCTIAGNTSNSTTDFNVGLYNGYYVNASYCILSGNTGLDVYTENTQFVTPTSLAGVNILVNEAGIPSGGTGTRLTSDPLLAALASNGGPTQTRAIPTNSPARNAGTGSTATVDQRGFAMVGVPDLGAYEAGAAAASTISDIANQSINEDTATSALTFTLGDTVVSPSSLTVTGGSSNTTLVPNANIVFGGSGASRTVTVTPAANQFGTATITVTVGGGSSAATDSFVLTVNAQNDAPFAFTFPTNPLSIPRDTNTGDIPFTIGDLETAASSLTLTKSSGNLTLVPTANIVFGGSGASRTVRITPAAGQTGSAFITIGVNDGTTTTTSILQLTVTAPAVTTISDIANLSINEDTATSALAFTLGDTVVSPAILTVTGGSSNTTLVPNANIVFGGSGASRTVTVTPAANQFGTATITVTVGGGSSAASDSFVLTVNPVNDAPTLAEILDQGIDQDSDTGLIALVIGDVDTPVNNLTLTGASDDEALVPVANIVFAGSGGSRTLRVTPRAGVTGAATITIGVSDGNQTTFRSFFLDVLPPPLTTISDIPDATRNEDSSYSSPYSIGDTRVSTAGLSVTATSSNPALVPNANITLFTKGGRSISVAPAHDQHGTTTITVTVSGGSTPASDSFVLTVLPVNDAPTLSGLSDRSIAVDTTTGPIALTLADVDTPVTSLTLTGGSNNQTLVPDANIVLGGSGADRTLLITPAAGQTGTANIMVRVSDGDLNSDAFFTLTVVAPAADPLLVTTLADENDSPAGPWISLREAVREAPAGSTIRFSPLLSGLTIQLVDQILLAKDVHIDAGNLPGGIRLRGHRNEVWMGEGGSRIFQVENAIDITTATGSTATQSTGYDGDQHPATNGIDGDTGNFTHTDGFSNDANPTWTVDFHRDVLLDRIRVHNRDDCCGARLSDIILTVLDANGATLHTSERLNPDNALGDPEFLDVRLPNPESARRIEVRRSPDSTISGDTILSIGELQVFLDAGSGVTLTRLTLTEGYGGGDAIGGGIFNSGMLTMRECTLTRYKVGFAGGAIYNRGTLLLERCTLANCESVAAWGAAIFNESTGLATLTQCTLADNIQSAGLGAVSNYGEMNLSHCTLVGGGNPSGQRIINEGSLRLENCIVSCNTLSGCGPGTGDFRLDLINRGVVERVGANLLLDYVDVAGSGSSSGPTPIGDIARLAPLGDYGGPTPTCPPLPGSPALDAAVDATATTDQRGFSRPIGAAADLGAAEYRPDLVVTTAADELDEPAGTLLSLREAMRDAEPDARIRFDASLSGQTLTLTRGELSEDKSLTIDALDLSAAFTISGNRASRIFNVLQDRSLALAGLHLTMGDANQGNAMGGAIQAYFGTVTLDRVHVFDNAAIVGGGVHLFGGIFSANDSTFSGNSSDTGGGIYFAAVNSLDHRFPLLTHCTFSGNNAAVKGGGFYVYDGFAFLRHCTFSGNAAPTSRGGGINSQGDLIKTWLSHCIVAGNGGGDLAPGNAFSSAGGNLIGLGGASGSGSFTQPGDRTGVTDPRLAPLGYHGGRTQTMPPLVGSPAIDPVGGVESSVFATDQRGWPRVRDGDGNGSAVLDTGAVEAGNVLLVTTTSDTTADDGQTTLREAIAAASEPGARVLFDPSVFPATIGLAQGELTVDRPIVIDAGNLAGGVTVDGQAASRIFTTAAGGVLDLSPASGATATQSTALNNELYPAGNALDGDLGNFTHTDVGDPDPTWSVDFGRDVWIDTITLHNRENCCAERLSDITVRVYTGTEAPYLLVYQSPVLNPLNTLQGPALLRVRLPAALAARRIEVKRDPASTDEPGVLSLGEVRVSLEGGASILGLNLVNGNGVGARQTGLGGAILNQGALLLANSSVSANVATGNGGGVCNTGALQVRGCLFADNITAASGGGIQSQFDGASLDAQNSTFARNRANGAGGGGVNITGLSTATLTHCTVVENQAPNGPGGGLRRNNGTFQLAYSIVSQNTANTRPDLTLSITETKPNHIGGNPRLAPLANYGGPTLTLAPASDSPALNAAIGSTTRVDQRGFPRDSLPDLGAYEAGPASNYAAWIWESLPFNSTTGDRASGTDLDGDHATNGEEYEMRTNPNLVTSVLKVSGLTRATLTFSSVVGVTYHLQTANALLPGGDTVWTEIGEAIVGTGSDIILNLPVGETATVYRVRVGP